MLELVVVVAIVAMCLTLIVPKVGRMPRSVVVRNALSQLRIAFRDAGLRARASGKPVRLHLDATGHRMRISDSPAAVEGTFLPPTRIPAGIGEPTLEPQAPGFISRLSDYELPAEIEWHLQDTKTIMADAAGDEGAYFDFFPSGEAAGTALEFSVRKTRFRLDADRLTGRPIIAELSEFSVR